MTGTVSYQKMTSPNPSPSPGRLSRATALTPAVRMGLSIAVATGLEPVYDLYGAALGCNRDEWVVRARRMGSCPCKSLDGSIARFHPNPQGKSLVGRSAALRCLPIAGLLAAHRALHPIPTRRLRGPV